PAAVKLQTQVSRPPHTYISSAASHSCGMLRMMSPQSMVIEPEGNIVGFSKYVERACSIVSGSTFQDSVLSTTPSSRLPDDVTEYPTPPLSKKAEASPTLRKLELSGSRSAARPTTSMATR